MPINALMMTEGEPVFYEDSFRRMLETHLIWMKEQGAEMVTVDPHDALKYKGDLFGLLIKMGYAPQYHYAIMILNEISGPQSNTETLRSLLVPAQQAIDVLRARFKIVAKRTT